MTFNTASVDLSGPSANLLLKHLIEVISSKEFLTMQGLNNEVPFFICPYKPELSVEMARLYQQLCKKLDQKEVRVLEINLFNLCLEILESRDLLNRILAGESTMNKSKIKEALQGVLDPERHLVPAISKKVKSADFDVLFVTGVGEVFPFIRSHNILNNLQRAVKKHPMVMFFPGSYQHELATGASLDLFSRLHDDKYYRAYNILTMKAAS